MRKKQNMCKKTYMELKNDLATKLQHAKHRYSNFSLPEFLKADPSKLWHYLRQTKESVQKNYNKSSACN